MEVGQLSLTAVQQRKAYNFEFTGEEANLMVENLRRHSGGLGGGRKACQRREGKRGKLSETVCHG